MATIMCRDVLNTVYIYVKGCYIEKYYSTITKIRTSSKGLNEDENLIMTKTDAPTGESNVNEREVSETFSESVREITERKTESEVANQIRMEIDLKLPCALSAVCGNLATLDRKYRAFKGYEKQESFPEDKLDATGVFPLSGRFLYPCIMYISSMVLIDVDEQKSDEYYKEYVSSLSSIIAEIPFESAPTVEKYPYQIKKPDAILRRVFKFLLKILKNVEKMLDK